LSRLALSRIVYHDFRGFLGLIVPKCSQLFEDARTLNFGRGPARTALLIRACAGIF